MHSEPHTQQIHTFFHHSFGFSLFDNSTNFVVFNNAIQRECQQFFIRPRKWNTVEFFLSTMILFGKLEIYSVMLLCALASLDMNTN